MSKDINDELYSEIIKTSKKITETINNKINKNNNNKIEELINNDPRKKEKINYKKEIKKDLNLY